MTHPRTTRTVRRAAAVLTALALAVPLVACTASEAPVGEVPSSTATPPPPTDAAATDAAPTTPPAAAPRTDVTADVLLPRDAFATDGEGGSETDAVEAWRVPDACGAVVPEQATAMRTHVHGDGELESVVGVQQVAAFATADDAVSAAGALGETLAGCTGAEGATYRPEPVAVGAQGAGLVTDYYGSGGDTAMGTYLAVTRRGNAVTLVSAEGGEATVGTARSRVTAQAQQAWELLCAYDAAGC